MQLTKAAFATTHTDDEGKTCTLFFGATAKGKTRFDNSGYPINELKGDGMRRYKSLMFLGTLLVLSSGTIWLFSRMATIPVAKSPSPLMFEFTAGVGLLVLLIGLAGVLSNRYPQKW